MDKPITSFSGEYSWLSNMHLCTVEFQNVLYLSSEHLYQSLKCKYAHERERIRLEPSPYKAKRLGRKIALRDNWEEIKYDAMLATVRAKFAYGSQLGLSLLMTGDAELVEGNNWHDNYWGSCTCAGCSMKLGKNTLGRILMLVREELRQEAESRE